MPRGRNMRRPRAAGYGHGCAALHDWHAPSAQSLDSPPIAADPRCSCSLYESLCDAAHLIQQNRFDDARDKALSAFGIIPSLAGGD